MFLEIFSSDSCWSLSKSVSRNWWARSECFFEQIKTRLAVLGRNERWKLGARVHRGRLQPEWSVWSCRRGSSRATLVRSGDRLQSEISGYVFHFFYFFLLIWLKRANQRKCVENGLQPSWGEWSEWSACSATCINPVTGSMVDPSSEKSRFKSILSPSEKKRETASQALNHSLAKLKKYLRAPARPWPRAAMKGKPYS